jgi:chemotaxis protein CheD
VSQHLFASQALQAGQARHLLAGEWALARAEAGDGPLRTLLGSCLAVALWHREAGVGTVCHAVLPSRRGAAAGALRGPRGGPGAALAEAHFLDEALPLMVDALQARGLKPQDCEASLVGGASLIAAFAPGSAGAQPVGAQNAIAAQRLAQALGLRVVNRALGGAQPQQLSLDARTGQLMVRALVAPRPSLGVGHQRLA